MFELNKFAGAILLVTLTVTVIGMLGDALLEQKRPGAPQEVATGVAPERAVEEGAETAAGEAARTEPGAPAPAEGLVPVSPMLADADEARGRKLFRKCSACHSAAEGAKAKIGPNLWNIVNAPVARSDGFSYSSAMASREGRWDYESLNAFLADPKTDIAGTKMQFAGLKRATDRADLIVYLRSLSEFPVPLP